MRTKDLAIVYLLPLAKDGSLQAIGEGQPLLQRRDGRPRGLFQGFCLQRQLGSQALSRLKPRHQDLIEGWTDLLVCYVET